MSFASGNAWLGWAVLAAVFAAATAIFAKLGVQEVDPDYATLVRTTFVLVALVAFVALNGKWMPPSAVPANAWLFLFLSAMATGASWLCYFRALQLGPVTLVAPIDKLSVVFAAVFAVAFLRERPSLQEWAGIGLIGAGAVLLVLKRA